MTAATAPGTMCARSARFRPARAVRGGSCATRRADHHQDVRSVSSSRQRPGLNLMPQSSPAQAPHRRSSQWHHERHLRRLVRVRPGSSRRSPHITFKRQLICAHTAADMRKVERELIVHWGRCGCGALRSRIVRGHVLLPCPGRASSPPAAREASSLHGIGVAKVRDFSVPYHPLGGGGEADAPAG